MINLCARRNMTDLSEYVQKRIDAAPVKTGVGFCRRGAYCIDLPQGEYDWNNAVTIPDDKSIIIKGCGSWATIINNNTGQPYIIDAQAINNVGHVFEFSGASVWEGSVQVGRRRGVTCLRDLKFMESPAPAMDFYGDDNDLGAVNVHIEKVETDRCAMGIRCQMKSHCLFNVEKSRFIGSLQESIYIDAVGSRIERCDFQACNGQGFIRYGGDVERSSHHSVIFSRFGSEDINTKDQQTSIDKPDYDVIIGPSATRGGVYRFRDNEHMGRETTAKPGALAAFKLDVGALNMHVTGSFFSNKYQNFIVEETVTTSSQDNIWRENIVQTGSPTLFSQGGVGWSLS